MVCDDISNIIGEFEKFKGVDLVFGGPPCQGFSVAGKMNPNDERSKFILTFLDAVEKIQPRAFIMENVKALAVLDKWKSIRERYLNKAIGLGYTCIPFVLNATEYGVPQKRERVFFIGFKDELAPSHSDQVRNLIEQQKQPAMTVRDSLRKLGRAGTEKIQILVQLKLHLLQIQL